MYLREEPRLDRRGRPDAATVFLRTPCTRDGEFGAASTVFVSPWTKLDGAPDSPIGFHTAARALCSTHNVGLGSPRACRPPLFRRRASRRDP